MLESKAQKGGDLYFLCCMNTEILYYMYLTQVQPQISLLMEQLENHAHPETIVHKELQHRSHAQRVHGLTGQCSFYLMA